VFTPLGLVDAAADGEPSTPQAGGELGHNVFSQLVDIPAGATAVLEYRLSGNVGPGDYRLVYRPQPLPEPDRLVVQATTSSGDTLFDFVGTPERRSIISADGVEAWR
jgi:hypothetical protein